MIGFVEALATDPTDSCSPPEYWFRTSKDQTQLIRTSLPLSVDEEVEIEGEGIMKDDETTVFLVHKVKRLPVYTIDTLIHKLTKSKSMPGIGAGTAQKIIKGLGVIGALKAIRWDEMLLANMPGVGPKRAGIIVKGFHAVEVKAHSEESVVIALMNAGLANWAAKKVFKQYGGEGIAIALKSPYRLCGEVHGIGFRTADEFALRNGLPVDSPDRIRAGLLYILTASTNTGHCGMPLSALSKKAATDMTIDHDLCHRIMREALEFPGKFGMVEHGSFIYTTRLAAAEEKIAQEILRLSTGAPIWSRYLPPSAVVKAIIEAENALGVELASQQREAVRVALTSRCSVLTGGPGTGKTKTMEVLMYILRHMPGYGDAGVSISLGAQTGKAARRASETTGLPGSTVHRMLGLRGDEKSDIVITSHLVVIDEFSMMDTILTAELLGSLSSDTSFLMVGDVDQLASVGAGQVLRDVIDSGVVPVTRLDQIFRQAAGSKIIVNAHKINHGLPIERSAQDSDFFFVKIEDKDSVEATGKAVAETLVDIVCARLPKKYGFNPARDIQILSPMYKGACGLDELNLRLQDELNPEVKGSPTIRKGGITFRINDKVIQTRNNYDLDVLNGDIGFITDINPRTGFVSIDFSGTLVSIPSDDMEDIRLAYVITIHKSQGSEFPVVVMPLTTQHHIMMVRNLLYTGVTRAKALMILVGQESALKRAILNQSSNYRVTRLKSLLVQGVA